MKNTKETFDLKITSSYNPWNEELLDEEYTYLFQGQLKHNKIECLFEYGKAKKWFLYIKKVDYEKSIKILKESGHSNISHEEIN